MLMGINIFPMCWVTDDKDKKIYSIGESMLICSIGYMAASVEIRYETKNQNVRHSFKYRIAGYPRI